MSYMVFLVLPQSDLLDAVLDAWRGVGVEDITVLQSKSMIQQTSRCNRDDLPLFPSMHDLFDNDEFDHYTLFSVVGSEDLIDRLIAATEREVGDLDRPDNGVMFALPVVRSKGMRLPR
ncbi:hypothetical protein F8S13_20450 [Chloroflexia bacterium SDU3-3]|nr:hypothetical protein F8S13_20450 [Chloroflexia bacterium SDU3-3]